MKKVMFLAMFAVMMFGTLATGYADQGDWRGGIRSRIQEARQKIDGGIAAGTLDRREAGRLNGELGSILDKIERLKSDGQFTQGERDQVKNDLDRLDRDIFREKHDAVVVIAPVSVDWRGGIRSRIQEARQKIDGGLAAGTLNRREAGRLNGELGVILNKIDRMKSDGQFTERERDQVKNDLDRLDRDIFKEKHDGVVVTAPVQIDWRGGIRSRIEGARLKIDQGIQAGTLNRHEARKLDKELSRILGKIEGMKSDGRLSLGERNKINRNLDRLDGDIARNTHN
jgi:predicted nuclease with TOPRIM domain